MTTTGITLVDAQSAQAIEAQVTGGRVRVSGATLESATGWSVKPEGFCLGEVCVPAGSAVGDEGWVDLTAFAERLGRPLIFDAAEHCVSLGAPAAARGDELTSLQAPDFTLPDLDGTLHSLSDYRGRKILLAAYASW